MKTIVVLMAALFLAAAVTPAPGQIGATARERDDGSRLLVMPSRVSEYDEYRINTQKQVRQSDGDVHDLYVTRKPAKGNVFVNIELQVSTPDTLKITGSDMALTGSVSDSTETYFPFDWFIEAGAGEDRGDVLIIPEKAIVNATFEVPLVGKDRLVLSFATRTIGTLGDMKKLPGIHTGGVE